MLHIYKASAGSGKTFTLAYQYIKMLLGRKDPDTGRYSLISSPAMAHRHILAVTFSNKATDEMKKRIIYQLALLARLEPSTTATSPYLSKLAADFSASPQAVSDAAAIALKQLLFDFNFFQVSTIDSFFQVILRTFAREADLSAAYELDLESETAVTHGVRQLFDSLSTDAASPSTRRLIAWITQYLLSKLQQGKQISLFNRNSNVYSEFISFIRSITNDIFAQHYEQMMQYLSDHRRLRLFSAQISQREAATINLCRNLCAQALDAILSRGYDAGRLKVNAHLLARLRILAISGDDSAAPPSTIDTVAADISKAFLKDLKAHLLANPDPQLTSAISQAAEAVAASRSELKILRTTRANLYVLGLLERICHYIEQYRAQTNTFLLSDTNNLLRTIIGSDDAPFVYERIGVRLSHYLIDEFQDTSTLQWECLRPLLAEGQSRGDDSLIIGDEKQCIYRFRFSDPSLLRTRVAHEFQSLTSVKGDDPADNTNWRSSAHVVTFNNAIFSSMASTLGFSQLYSNVCQQVSPAHQAHTGYIAISSIDAPTADLFQNLALTRMYAEICRQLDAGYSPADIAILVRFRAEGAAVISYLMEQFAADASHPDIRIVSDDAMLVSSAPAVSLIISIMRFLAMPRADVDPTDSSHRRVSMRQIRDLSIWYQHILSSGVSSPQALRQAIERLAHAAAPSHVSDSLGHMANFNLPSLLEQILASFISPQVAHDQNMYITALADIVADFCSRGPADLAEFLRWWDDQGIKAQISAPFDSRAIRVMTIHKSKGLEFPCVHIPFANWNFVSFRSSEWFLTNGQFYGIDPELIPPMLPFLPSSILENSPFATQYLNRVAEQTLDELNVAYVAFTRAVDELIISTSARPSSSISLDQILSQALASPLPGVEITQTLPPAHNLPPQVTLLTYGSPTTPRPAQAKTLTALDPSSSLTMDLYTSLPRNDLWAAMRLDAPPSYTSARQRGIVLHDILSRVRHASSLPAAIQAVAYLGQLPPDQQPIVAHHLASQLARPEIAPWFTLYTRLLCERPLLAPDGEILRPDRVVWMPDGSIIVIDYKFGEEKPTLYRRQILRYIQALQAMGHTRISGRILYLDSGRITTIHHS